MDQPNAVSTLPEQDRNSLQYAQRIVEAIIPAADLRQVVLKGLADSIAVAHEVGPEGWSVTLFHNGVRLNVGPVQAYVLGRYGKENLWLILKPTDLTPEDKRLVDRLAKWDEKPFKAVPGARGVRIPLQAVSQLLPMVQKAHFATLQQAAQRRQKTLWYESHSPGVLRYLTAELGQAMPTPKYVQPTADWRACLQEWLQRNPRTMTEAMRRLREEFVRRFPKEKLADMTLEQYALGQRESKESFCYWLEFKTQHMGRIGGGTATKHGVYWGKDEGRWKWVGHLQSRTAEEALSKIKQALVNLVQAAENEDYARLDEAGPAGIGHYAYSLRSKPLYLYFPDRFLPISSGEHLKHFLEVFGEQPQYSPRGPNASPIRLNRQLLQTLRSHPEFDGFDTQQMMCFLYDCLRPPQQGQDETVSPIWKVAPGEGARLWDMCRERGCIAVAWLGDTSFRTLEDREDIKEALQAANQGSDINVSQVWNFAYEIEPGDIIVANRGQKTVVGVGVVTSDYIAPLEPDNPSADNQYRHTRRVEWRIDRPVDVPFQFAQQTVSPLTPERWRQIREAYLQAYPDLKGALESLEPSSPPDPSPPAPIAIPPEVARLMEMATHTRNILLYGPPGTGKTWLVNRFADYFLLSSGEVREYLEFVTFHQSFAYEEFVEGLRPVPPNEEGGPVSYRVERGVFRRICKRAEAAWKAQPDNPPKYLLVLDEINRANIAKVFGELITLIEDDKRLGRANEVTVTLPYSKDRFGVPPNLYLLGTMNTADRSIALLDLALRRRFAFVEMKPDPDQLKVVAGVDLRALLTTLNQRISVLLDRDHQIGHSYLMNVTDADELRFVWYHRVIPLLQEYFYNDGERLHAVLGDAFVTKKTLKETLDETTRKALEAVCDVDAPRYEVKELKGDAFVQALQALAQGGSTPTG